MQQDLRLMPLERAAGGGITSPPLFAFQIREKLKNLVALAIVEPPQALVAGLETT